MLAGVFGRTANGSGVWWLELGNWVNEVSGHFSQYNDPTWNLIYSVSWFPYERPDRPSRLKKCSDDRDDHMETLPRRSQTTPDDLDDLDRLDRVEFYRDDHVNFKAIIWKRSQTIGTIEGYPRSHRFFPVIENKFGPDGVEAEKTIYKCSQRVWGLFEIRESPWHQVFDEMPCLWGTVLASQCRKIKRKSRFALQIKIIHLCGLFAKHAPKFHCLTQRHRWRPASHMETTYRPPVVRMVSKYFETTGAIGNPNH